MEQLVYLNASCFTPIIHSKNYISLVTMKQKGSTSNTFLHLVAAFLSYERTLSNHAVQVHYLKNK